MSGFSAEWLALREPADVAARSIEVTATVLASLVGRTPLRGVDLGSGTGSNIRYLSPQLPTCDWRLVDNDAALLDAARHALGGRQSRATSINIETRVADLQTLDGTALDGCALVTASALLDLVSESWLARLVGLAADAGAQVLMALNYDGRIVCTPPERDDDLVHDLVNRHQVTDKGFGPALGPSAGIRAEALLRDAGYRVCRAPSDWVLGPAHNELQRQLIAGWAHAAMELAPDLSSRIQSWTARRLAHLSAGTSHLIVGHDDVGGALTKLENW
ncbi:MAG: class I SAM-dependent methyltransferase [Vicinamibacterales bacterium]